MKKMKRALSFLLVLTMLVAMSITGFAADSTNSSIKVMLNGEYVPFADAVPEVINGRTMVPYTAIFEALGAEVAWDQATTTVTAATDELNMSFVIGKPDLNITYKDGKTEKKQMDVAPFVDSKTNRTMVSVRFISESMGYGVGWDQENKTAVIIDWDKLIGELGDINKDFSILSKVASSSSTEDLNKTYKTTGSLEMSATAEPAMLKDMGIEGADKAATIKVTGDLEGLSKGLNVDMKMGLKCDLSGIESLPTTDEGKAVVKELNEMLGNMEMLIKMNGETGDTYIQSDAMLTGTDLPEGTWVSMNVYDTYKAMGVDLESMMKEMTSDADINIAESVTESLKATEDYTIDTYGSVKTVYAVFKSLLGDSAFTTKTEGDTTTYSAEITSAKLLAAITGAAGTSATEADLAEIKDALKAVLALSGKVEFSIKGDVVTDMDMSLSYKDNETTVSMEIAGGQTDSNMSFTIAQKDQFSLDISAKASSVESNETVSTSIPSGAKVIKIEELTASTAA